MGTGQGSGKADAKPARDSQDTEPEDRVDHRSAGGFGGRVADPGHRGLCLLMNRDLALLGGNWEGEIEVAKERGVRHDRQPDGGASLSSLAAARRT
jgi:hypothetical protein